MEEGEIHLVSIQNSEPVIQEIPMIDSIILENPMEDLIMQEPLNYLVGVTPPSYAEILKKKSVESSRSSGKDEHFTKKVGRKS